MPVVAGSGYQHSLSEIREKIRYKLGQTSASNSNWDDDTIDDAINDALKEMLIEGIVEVGTDTFTSTASQQDWTIPETAWKVVAINYDDTVLKEIRRDQFDSITSGDSDSLSGDPEFWFVDETQNDRTVKFDKKMPVNKTVKYWFWRCPTDLNSDDELTGLYRVMSPLVVYLALSTVHENIGNTETAQRWFNRYERLLPKAKLHIDEPHESDEFCVKDHVGGFCG